MIQPTGVNTIAMHLVPTGNTNQFKIITTRKHHGKDIFIMKAKVLQAFRKANKVIYGYRIQDEYGRIKDVGPVTLKNAIKITKE